MWFPFNRPGLFKNRYSRTESGRIRWLLWNWMNWEFQTKIWVPWWVRRTQNFRTLILGGPLLKHPNFPFAGKVAPKEELSSPKVGGKFPADDFRLAVKAATNSWANWNEAWVEKNIELFEDHWVYGGTVVNEVDISQIWGIKRRHFSSQKRNGIPVPEFTKGCFTSPSPCLINLPLLEEVAWSQREATEMWVTMVASIFSVRTVEVPNHELGRSSTIEKEGWKDSMLALICSASRTRLSVRWVLSSC